MAGGEGELGSAGSMLAAADRLVADTALDLVARRLRMLGYDVEIRPGESLEALFRHAAAEGRTVLTTSRRHPAAWAHVPCCVVPHGDALNAVRRVTERFRAADPPFARCPHCNLRLETRASATAGDRVPAAVRARWPELRHCARCGRWFWPGSHVTRLRGWLERATGRSVAGPGAVG